MVRMNLPAATPRDALDDTAAALGLLLVNIVPQTDAFPAQRVYVTPDRGAAVHLVEDRGSGAVAWVVRGEGEAAPAVEARWIEAIRDRLAEAP